jgi:hypothetical protein
LAARHEPLSFPVQFVIFCTFGRCCYGVTSFLTKKCSVSPYIYLLGFCSPISAAFYWVNRPSAVHT